VTKREPDPLGQNLTALTLVNTNTETWFARSGDGRELAALDCKKLLLGNPN
jgi:hypothetical protein